MCRGAHLRVHRHPREGARDSGEARAARIVAASDDFAAAYEQRPVLDVQLRAFCLFGGLIQETNSAAHGLAARWGWHGMERVRPAICLREGAVPMGRAHQDGSERSERKGATGATADWIAGANQVDMMISYHIQPSGGRKNLGVHLCLSSGFRWSQGLAGWFGGGVTAGTRGVTGGKMGESAKEANVDTVGVT